MALMTAVRNTRLPHEPLPCPFKLMPVSSLAEKCAILAMDKPTAPLKICDARQNGVPPVEAQVHTPQHGKEEDIRHVLDHLPHCAAGLVDMTPQEIVAEEPEAPRQQDGGKNARGTHELCGSRRVAR